MQTQEDGEHVGVHLHSKDKTRNMKLKYSIIVEELQDWITDQHRSDFCIPLLEL